MFNIKIHCFIYNTSAFSHFIKTNNLTIIHIFYLKTIIFTYNKITQNLLKQSQNILNILLDV